jgi:hypothetical protein
MSSTNKTAKFKLSQFIGTDKPTFLGDYNNDMQIIDGALFTASQTAEEAVNDVENVKSAQTELKAVHEDTKQQVAQLKETADGMTGDVTTAQEAANSAEEKATAAQTAATSVLNAANAASANATKAKQTADGNKTTLQELDQRVTELENAPKVTEIVFKCIGCAASEGSTAIGSVFYKKINNLTLKSAKLYTDANTMFGCGVEGVTGVTGAIGNTPVTFNADQVTGESFKLTKGINTHSMGTIEVELTYIVSA